MYVEDSCDICSKLGEPLLRECPKCGRLWVLCSDHVQGAKCIDVKAQPPKFDQDWKGCGSDLVK
jgi:hypothetical protein